MYIKEAHIMIEQGLQQVGVFADYDISPDEIDLAIKEWIWKIMDREFPNERGQKLNKPKVDKYAILIEKEKEFLATVTNRGDYEVALPDNYFHLIKADAEVVFACDFTKIKSGSLIENEWYQNIGEIPIAYNGISIPIRKIFRATSNANYNHTIAKEAHIIKLNKKISPLRFVEEEFSSLINQSGLTKTSSKSPIATVSGKKITINVNGFFIEKVYISYLRKPKDPNYRYKVITPTTDMVVDKEYEVIEGTVTYNGTVYKGGERFNFPSFKILTGKYRFTGTGEVRLKGDGDIELPYQVALEIKDKVLLDLSIQSENNPQKIQGLAQINNKV